jgi:hypothetical protein
MINVHNLLVLRPIYLRLLPNMPPLGQQEQVEMIKITPCGRDQVRMLSKEISTKFFVLDTFH